MTAATPDSSAPSPERLPLFEQQIREALGPYIDTIDLLQERISELEREDAGWQSVLGGENENDFSRENLAAIIALCRLAYLKNPLINRGVNVQVYYVWGQGVTIQARDERVNEVVQAFLDDPGNQAEFSGQQARNEKEVELNVHGNIFFVLFTDLTEGNVKVRSIPVWEVQDIISNPEDRRDVWFYKRQWTERRFDVGSGRTADAQRTAYYPDYRYQPKGTRLQQIGGHPVQWDAPVYHVKVGGLSDQRFGLPEVYQAVDWAKAYKIFLENWATIVKAYSMFAWQFTSRSGAKGVAAAKARLGSTAVTAGRETNPPPATGSVFASTEGTNMTPIRTAGATTSADDGRRLLLMVCAAVGLPETFFGDIQGGTLATAKSLDRPTELKFRDRQSLWAHIIRTLCGYAVDQAMGARSAGLSVAEDQDRTVDVSFPELLEHDPREVVAAIVSAATLDGKPLAYTMDRRTLSQLINRALGIENSDELLKQWFPEGMEDGPLVLPEPPAPVEPSPPGEDDEPEEDGQEEEPTEEAMDMMVEAVRELRAVLAGLAGAA